MSLRRATILAAILLVELLAITNWLDGADLAGRSGLAGQIGLTGAWILRFAVAFSAAFAAFAGSRGTWKNAQARIGAIRWNWLVAHLLLGSLFVAASREIGRAHV